MTARLECNVTGSEAGREENFPNGFPNRIPNRFNAEQALFETLYRNRPSLLIGNTLCGLLMAIIGWFDGYAYVELWFAGVVAANSLSLSTVYFFKNRIGPYKSPFIWRWSFCLTNIIGGAAQGAGAFLFLSPELQFCALLYLFTLGGLMVGTTPVGIFMPAYFAFIGGLLTVFWAASLTVLSDQIAIILVFTALYAAVTTKVAMSIGQTVRKSLELAATNQALAHKLIDANQVLNKARTNAENADRAKSEFLANISHELRTPLNAILGFSDVLKQQLWGAIGDPRYTEYAADIHDSGQHLLSLINQLLDISQADAGKLQLVEEEIDIVPLVEDACHLLREVAHSQQVSLSLSLGSDLPPLLADPMRVKQIMLNLIGNALKYSAEGGMVTVTAALSGSGEFTVAVRDNGAGMSPEELAQVKKAFTRTKRAIVSGTEGSGLGLAIVESMIAAHGGHFQLQSQPGEGTTAQIIFPASRVVRVAA